MESASFWIYDIEDGYVKLETFPESRADKALYLLSEGKNITKTVTGQTRLTPYTYKCIWHQIVTKKNYNYSDIRRYIRERKNQLTKVHQKPATRQETLKTKRSEERLRLWKQRRSIAFISSETLTPSTLRLSNPVEPFKPTPALLEPIQFEEPAVQRSTALAIAEPASSPVAELLEIAAPSPAASTFDPAPLYARITEASLLQRIEEPKNFQIAQYKVIKNLVHEGDSICFPMSELSMDMHLAREGLPTDPELLDKLIIEACARRNITYDTKNVFADFRRTLGYVKHFPHLSPPHCYQYIKC